MNFNIFRMSMYQSRKSYMAWLITIPLLVAFGMAFYPAISSSLSDLVGLFENPMMKGILGLFAMGPEQLNSLPGFYITYASIYVILMGGIFAALTIISDLGGELRDKTTEFLLTRPVTRRTVIVTKWFAAVCRVFGMTLVLFVVTIMSFSVFSKDAAMIYFEEDKALSFVEAELGESPEKISRVWTLDEDFFKGWMMHTITSLMESDPGALEELDVDPSVLEDLISLLEEDPESLFDDLLTHPETYMDMFNIPGDQKDLFIESINERKLEFETLKKRYVSDSSFHYEMFTMTPGYFMRLVKTSDQKALLIEQYPNIEKEVNKLIGPYSISRLMVLHIYLFLFMTTIVSLATGLSVGLKDPKNISSLGIGMVLVMYFISTLLKVSPVTAAWSWISPFGLIDQGLTGGEYTIKAFNVGLLLIESLGFLGISLVLFEKKDL